jgi:predicted RNase H-like nuclease (RuvC/YqgF family)
MARDYPKNTLSTRSIGGASMDRRATFSGAITDTNSLGTPTTSSIATPVVAASSSNNGDKAKITKLTADLQRLRTLIQGREAKIKELEDRMDEIQRKSERDLKDRDRVIISHTYYT